MNENQRVIAGLALEKGAGRDKTSAVMPVAAAIAWMARENRSLGVVDLDPQPAFDGTDTQDRFMLNDRKSLVAAVSRLPQVHGYEQGIRPDFEA